MSKYSDDLELQSLAEQLELLIRQMKENGVDPRIAVFQDLPPSLVLYKNRSHKTINGLDMEDLRDK